MHVKAVSPSVKASSPARARASLSGSRPAAPVTSYTTLHSFSDVAVDALILQRKLMVGAVDDPLEREADRMADLVMRMPPSALSVASAPLQLSRKCAACEDKDKTLQTKARGTRTAPVGDAATRSVHEALRLPGQPLDPTARTFFEQRFGHDLSQVRVHADNAAAASTSAVQARAYTFGQDIVFGSSEYAPSSAEGRRLIAHELVHVMQQGKTTSPARALIQRQPDPRVHSTLPSGGTLNVSSEKWSTYAEQAYRRAGLLRQANAVRLCREEGACGKLLTEAEAWQMYSSGRIAAGLGPPTAAGGVPPSHSVPQSPFVFGGVAAAPALQTGGGAAAPSAFAKSAAARGAARGLVSVPQAPPVPEAAAAAPEAAGAAAPEAAAAAPEVAGAAAPEVVAGAGAAPGAGLVTIAVPVAVGVVIVLEIASLVAWGQFQAKLEALGYVILPNPLGVCIGGCHQPAAPSFRPSPFEGPTTITGPGSLRDFPPIPPDWFRPEAARPRPAPPPQPVPLTPPEPMKPPGDCTKERHRELQDDVDDKCSRLPRGCTEDMDCRQLERNRFRNERCARARDRINNECFKGGDPGHKAAALAAWRAAENCRELYRRKC
jgi:hypothetical protein